MILKRPIIGILVFFTIVFSSTGFASDEQNSPVLTREEKMHRIFAQGAIINAGWDAIRHFRFDEAFKKLTEATEEKYLAEPRNKSFPLEILADLYRELGECQEALNVLSWHEEHLIHPRSQASINEKKAYLNACLEWQKTGDKSQVYLFIENFKKAHEAFIPPKRADQLVMSRIAELYDLIGDYDAGIQWAKQFRKKMQMKSTKKEYDQLIQAFEESKQGKPKVCSQDGKYCVGRATAVIIRSEYF